MHHTQTKQTLYLPSSQTSVEKRYKDTAN